MRKYNIINNTMGWLMFVVAAITYLLTIEPTASFWDCGEFIAQGNKLEVGHPPGNPIFMLAARFFINFASGPSTVAICVNAMSALLSAGTILLLFWTITHLVKRLVVEDNASDLSLVQYLIVMGSGVCGALVYTWSDTFWFSAVEGEVYAFSSFCTALVFWLILKWENVADEPHSDRWLILIAYVIGISVAVHLLNLLCIPAIVLIFYYRKWKNTNVKGSLIALAISFAIIALILFGLVPGFVKVAQSFELFFVNSLGLPFNSGVLAYFVIDLLVFAWCVYELRRQKNVGAIKFSFFLCIVVSGMLFIGDGWILPAILTLALLAYIINVKEIPVRIFSIVILSIFVIFIGYSSYALILIRSNANTPMDQNSPDNVFALGSYLNREQYGQKPLLYGQTFNSPVVYQYNSNGVPRAKANEGKALYSKGVKTSPEEKDFYHFDGYEQDYVMAPELDMLFPRLYSERHKALYMEWLGITEADLNQVEVVTRIDAEGKPIDSQYFSKPTFLQNLRFFFDYQLNYMYWRYFMWNFVGRQNDIQGTGEITHGNWISGISFIDNPRLGDQSLLPRDLGEGNKGHNVFFMLPLLLGIAGLLWQAYKDQRGIEQFWVIFFLFFMTGIAIVLYLNQTPSEPRERDYAFAGSFYAFAIWVGMGVAGIFNLVKLLLKKMNKSLDERGNIVVASIAALIGVLVPLQMVSQTWDDHDRSGRYACRDFGMNYLSSVGENGIIFTNGDNDTFPLWYAQEVEGYRTDVRVVNLSYLSTDWYIEQMRLQAYESAPLPMLSDRTTFAYSNRAFNYIIEPDSTPVTVQTALKHLYSPRYKDNDWNLPEVKYPVMYQPIDANSLVANKIIPEEEKSMVEEYIPFDFTTDPGTRSEGGLSTSRVASLDIISTNAEQGWKRPIYFAMTVPDRYYLNLAPYMQSTGLAYEVLPILHPQSHTDEFGVNTDKAFENVTTKFRWGGFENATPDNTIYADETVSRMVSTHRTTLCDLASALIVEGMEVKEAIKETKLPADSAKEYTDFVQDRFDKAATVLSLMNEKLPTFNVPYSVQSGYTVGQTYLLLGEASEKPEYTKEGLDILHSEILRYAEYFRFYQSLDAQLYSRLSNTDRYIDRRYLLELIHLYSSYAPEEDVKNLNGEMTGMGVNIGRLNQFLESYN